MKQQEKIARLAGYLETLEKDATKLTRTLCLFTKELAALKKDASNKSPFGAVYPLVDKE